MGTSIITYNENIRVYDYCAQLKKKHGLCKITNVQPFPLIEKGSIVEWEDRKCIIHHNQLPW
jgi:hypothetical protein